VIPVLQLKPVTWVISAGAALALILLTLHSCQNASQAGREAGLSAQTSKAALGSGKDAVGVVWGVSGRVEDSDAITRENDRAIHAAPGANLALPADVAAAGRAGLCQRRAYRCSRECVQRSVAAGMARAGAGCPAAGQ